jgi:hypothetical protein
LSETPKGPEPPRKPKPGGKAPTGKKKPKVNPKDAKKRPRGRPEFEFTQDHVSKIEALAMVGSPMDEMATILGCSEKTLERAHAAGKALADKDPTKLKNQDQIKRRIYDALLKGRATAKFEVRATLYDMVTKDKNPTMGIFYAKTQLGWKEPKSGIELSAPGGGPLVQQAPIVITPAVEKSLERIAASLELADPGDGTPAPPVLGPPKSRKGR